MLNAKRIEDLLSEAHADLRKYDDLRANTLQMIKTYEERLHLLGEGSVLQLPGVENTEVVTKSNTNTTAIFREVLGTANRPLTAKQIWERARNMGATTSSNNPVRFTDAVMRGLIRKGEVVQPDRGRFALSK
jgi:hypothetical protein